MLKSWLCDNKVLTLLTLLGMDSNKNQSITSPIVFFSHIPWCWKMSSVRGKLKPTSIIFCLEFLQTSVLTSSNVGHTVDSTRLFDMTWFPPSTQLVRKHFLLPSTGSSLQAMEISFIHFSVSCSKWKLHWYSEPCCVDHGPSSRRQPPPRCLDKRGLQTGCWPHILVTLNLLFLDILMQSE